MKIAIGTKVTRDPLGGGNQFAGSLTSYLRDHGYGVVDNLTTKDIDIILMTEPRRWLQSSSFGPLEIAEYLLKSNPNALVIHRVNECDQRKGTQYVNVQLELANLIADHTVYISSWLSDLFQSYKISSKNSVIRNGVDRKIFQFRLRRAPKPREKLRIVTHHWSPHWNKGWDVYVEIDKALATKQQFEFHYIGNRPDAIHTENIVFHGACSGLKLANLLSRAHLYLTASICEPAGMHHIEGASTGLPVVYRQSGALPEYCESYGESYQNQYNVWDAIERVRCNYPAYAANMARFQHDADTMAAQYVSLFKEVISNREKLLEERKNRVAFRDLRRLKIRYCRYYLLHRFGRQ